MIRIKSKQSYNERLQRIVEEYRNSGEPWPAPSKAVARWAIRTGRWAKHAASLVDICARELSHAMREEYHTDPQGRRVRTKHAAKFNFKFADGSDDQMTLWHDMRTAPRPFMERAFAQRRKQIVGDCKQLKNDVDSFNQNSSADNPIQLLLDFRDDVRELEHVRGGDSGESKAPESLVAKHRTAELISKADSALDVFRLLDLPVLNSPHTDVQAIEGADLVVPTAWRKSLPPTAG